MTNPKTLTEMIEESEPRIKCYSVISTEHLFGASTKSKTFIGVEDLSDLKSYDRMKQVTIELARALDEIKIRSNKLYEQELNQEPYVLLVQRYKADGIQAENTINRVKDILGGE